MPLDLKERRCFSVFNGHIADVAEAVVTVERTSQVVLIFNDLVIEVEIDDTRDTVVAKWNAKRIASIR